MCDFNSIVFSNRENSPASTDFSNSDVSYVQFFSFKHFLNTRRTQTKIEGF